MSCVLDTSAVRKSRTTVKTSLVIGCTYPHVKDPVHTFSMGLVDLD